ncbi:putative RmlC-like cupin family protein [Pedobacter sp. CG_S7]|uniref:sugar 3,4-ketoisomerase n=1 Tax=Pedobacter sp. CG_S7 TaxID=3143930 RepID=UPI003394358F
MLIDLAKIIELPKIFDERGNLSFLEEDNHIPFKMERVYWIYDVPGGSTRGGHAFKNQHELIIALSGSLDVIIGDGVNERRINLNRSYYGLYIPNMIWRQMDNFSTNSLALVVSSTAFDVTDYVYDKEAYLKLLNVFK